MSLLCSVVIHIYLLYLKYVHYACSCVVTIFYQDISVGYIIVTATATDNDLSSANNQIRYEILSGNDDGTYKIMQKIMFFIIKMLSYIGRFELHSTTGAFSVLNPLDREKEDRYNTSSNNFNS